VYDLTEAEQLCPGCGRLRTCIGEQVSEQLDYRPASYCVVQHVKKTYACRDCAGPGEQRFTTAGPATVGPIAKGLVGPGLLAHLITCKYADHLPLHRLEGIVARSGVDLARSTLCDWMAAAARLLTPLVALMHGMRPADHVGSGKCAKGSSPLIGVDQQADGLTALSSVLGYPAGACPTGAALA
jgi:transposase